MPSPNEVSLNKINHYLAPIVDELELLWNGVTLRTDECQEGRRIRAALILVLCDIPQQEKFAVMYRHWCHVIGAKRRQIMEIGNIILLE